MMKKRKIPYSPIKRPVSFYRIVKSQKIKIVTTRFTLYLFTILLMLFSGISTALAVQSSSGMVTHISGAVSYTSQDNQTPASLGPFMKLYDGDRVILEQGARLQLIFFTSGRKETWDGPADFFIGQSESRTQKEKGVPPKVSSLPDVVTKEVRRIAKIVDPSRMQKTGAKIVRGTPDDDKSEEPLPSVELDESEERELNLARNTYKTLVKDTSANDITPELFLFSVLADFDQFSEMKELIDLMKKKQPGNPTINQLNEWMEDQM